MRGMRISMIGAALGLLVWQAAAQTPAAIPKTPAEVSAQLKEKLAAPEIVTAAATGNLARVQALVGAGAKVDECNAITRQTALMAASMNGHAEVVDFLLRKGAEVGARDANLKQPLHHACGFGHEAIARRLLEAKAALESGDRAGFTLIYAAKQGHAKLAEFLLGKGAAIEGVDKMKMTPLMWAALKGQKSCVELLLGKGADKTAATGTGATAYDFAKTAGYKELLPLLEIKK